MKILLRWMVVWVLMGLTAGVRAQQPVPPPASQAQANAGTDTFFYITPATLAGYATMTATGGVTRAIVTNVVTDNALLRTDTNSFAAGITNLAKTYSDRTTNSAALSNNLYTSFVTYPTNTPTADQVLTFTGDGYKTKAVTAGAASQTPWATDIQAAENTLYDVAAIHMRDTGGSGTIQSSDGSSFIQIGDGSSGIIYEVSDGDHEFHGIVNITNISGNLSVSGAIATDTATITNFTFVGRSNAVLQIGSDGTIETNSVTTFPITGAGVAATWAQVQSLAPSVVQTNGQSTSYSNNVSVTAPAYYSPTNANNTGAYTAGLSYFTNLTGNITLAPFASIPSGSWAITIAAKADGTTRTITFPNGTVNNSANTAPAVAYVTNGTTLVLQVVGYGSAFTNVLTPH